ncbi:MAG: class I SAM-dependent methyltransferase [bacterium]|nr:class I SAM-dependent methyltransferase [bacterium]
MKSYFYSLLLFTLLFPFFSEKGQASFYVLKQDRGEDETWGRYIQKNPRYKKCVMEEVLKEISPVKDYVISSCTGQEVIEFFENQGLAPYIPEITMTEKGSRQTFQYGLGVEFSEHGNIESETIFHIEALLESNEKVTFMDIGGGYGRFIGDVLNNLSCETENLEIFFNELNSTQCYRAALKFREEGYENINFYPRDILGLLASGYGYSIEETFDITTCLNVYHFSNGKNGVEDSLKAVYDITNDGGIHIVVSLSPYYEGEDFVHAKTYEERILDEKEETYDYYFPTDEYGINRSCSLLTPERYSALFGKVGFTVLRSGYFTNEEHLPKKFSWIIGQKPE